MEIIFGLIISIISGFICLKLAKRKGLSKLWFLVGFFFNVFGIIFVLINFYNTPVITNDIDVKKEKKQIILLVCSLFLFISLLVIYDLLSTDIGGGVHWEVVSRIVDGKRQSEGPLFVRGRLFGMKPTNYFSLEYYAERERLEAPWFLVISDFLLQEKKIIDENSWRPLHSGGWGGSYPEPEFQFLGNDVSVPVSLPPKSYLWNFPRMKENNVFILNADGSLERLPVTVSSKEQMDKIEDKVIFNPHCINYKEAVLRILKEDNPKKKSQDVPGKKTQ